MSTAEITITLTAEQAALVHRLLVADRDAHAAAAASFGRAHRALIAADSDTAARTIAVNGKIDRNTAARLAHDTARTIAGDAFVAGIAL